MKSPVLTNYETFQTFETKIKIICNFTSPISHLLVFFPARWSICFLDHTFTGCGPGTRHRAVYCMSARDELLEDNVCNASKKPLDTGDCRVPCPSECVVSDWTEWGTCSKTCGKKGGVQVRTRKILGKNLNIYVTLRPDLGKIILRLTIFPVCPTGSLSA